MISSGAPVLVLHRLLLGHSTSGAVGESASRPERVRGGRDLLRGAQPRLPAAGSVRERFDGVRRERRRSTTVFSQLSN